MAANHLKYVRLFLILVRINYLKAMEYRLDFFAGLLPSGIYSAGYIIFVSLILHQVPSIQGWNLDQMIIFFAVEQLLYYSGWLLYRRSIDSFPELIRNGTFDFVSKLPVNTRFIVSFRDQSPAVVLPFLAAVLLVFYSVRNLPLNVFALIIFIFLIFLGIILLYNLLFTVAALSFWIMEADEFVGLIDEVFSFGRYPLTIYPSFIGLLLLTILPAVLMVHVPATALMGMVNIKLIILFLLMVFLSWIVSQKVWRMGLRRYSSASS